MAATATTERCIGEIWTLHCFVPSIPNKLMHGSRRSYTDVEVGPNGYPITGAP